MIKSQNNRAMYEENRTTVVYESKTDPPKQLCVVYFDDKEPDEVIHHEGVEYDRTENDFVFDYDSMPEHAKKDLAESAFHAFRRFMERSDARAILDAERERLLQEGSTLLSPRAK